ncbi:MAG: hypothetical protein R3F59_04185 [Myxococcota bacterium]
MRDRLVQALGALTLLVGCNGALFRFDVSDADTIAVDRGTVLEALVSDLGFDFLDADLEVSQALANQGVAPGDVDGVYFTDLTLTVVDPTGADLAFIDSLEFFVSGDGLPEQRVAWLDDFPAGVGAVALNLEDVDLTDYVVGESMDFRTRVAGHRPSQDTAIEAAFTLEIGATRQGACNQLKKDDGGT